MHWILLCLVAAIAGCARSPNAAAPSATPVGAPSGMVAAAPATSRTNDTELIVTPSRVIFGKITLVNPNARYVVVSYPIGVVPEVGRRLNVYRNGLKVGEIKISGPQRDVNTVADILAGECQVGDMVRPD